MLDLLAQISASLLILVSLFTLFVLMLALRHITHIAKETASVHAELRTLSAGFGEARRILVAAAQELPPIAELPPASPAPEQSAGSVHEETVLAPAGADAS